MCVCLCCWVCVLWISSANILHEIAFNFYSSLSVVVVVNVDYFNLFHFAMVLLLHFIFNIYLSLENQQRNPFDFFYSQINLVTKILQFVTLKMALEMHIKSDNTLTKFNRKFQMDLWDWNESERERGRRKKSKRERE